MKMKEYVIALNELIKNHPECIELDVVYARDNEGNGYELVHYSPTVGTHNDGAFEGIDGTEQKPNAVCIN